MWDRKRQKEGKVKASYETEKGRSGGNENEAGQRCGGK